MDIRITTARRHGFLTPTGVATIVVCARQAPIAEVGTGQ